MSEPKRAVPSCLEFPDSLGHATEKEKTREKGKQLAPSFRFTIALPESNDKAYSEFNYSQLVKSAEKKRRKEEQRANDVNATNGLDPFDDDGDDEEKLRDMANRFEAKYGTATAGRKRHKYDDYVDLGAGYDENDSFIDNTDAYDEIVPGEVTTAYGGFYINSGPLEFKPADGNSPVHSRLNNNNNNNEDEEESSDNSAEDDEEEANRVLQRMEKRRLSSSDEDDEEDILLDDPPRKKYKTEENGDKKSNHENVMKKKKKLPGDPCNPSDQQSDDLDGIQNARKNSNDEKREILDVECSSEDQEERKRTKYELNKTKIQPGDKKYEVKRIEKKFDIKRFEKKQPQPPPPSNGLDVKKIDIKKLVGKDSNIDDAIESVVNAGRAAEDESSRDTMDSGKSRCLIGTESECDDIEKEETLLPESLPDEIKDIINRLKSHADKNRDGKGKLFDETFNSALLILEEKLRTMSSPGARVITYGHLAHFLSCNKATLVNRAKKLCLRDTDKRMKDSLRRLKVIIEGMMPTVVERYAKECQRVAEEKGLEGSPGDVDSSDPESVEKSKIPRKKFPWSTETKKLIYDIACARRHYFKMRKPRKDTVETFIASYMESKVLPLWPGGWVRLETLLKYSNPEPVEKRKQKKMRDATRPNSLSSSALVNSVTRTELSNVAVVNATSQERAKTPTNSAKITTDNAYNFTTTTVHSSRTNETLNERKTSVKVREKNSESPVSMLMTQENLPSSNRDSMAKITVVPTSQLLTQKNVKSITEKFNPMDLTSSSLSITPVNDYQKTSKSPNETKKDVVSITPYSENPTNLANDSVTNTIGTAKSISGKHRIQESSEMKSEVKVDERTETNESSQKTEKKEKKRERWHDEKHRTHESKKKRKEKSAESTVQQGIMTKIEIPTIQQASSLSKEEQEQRQIEETMAATDFLSQIINDDLPRVTSEKRKEQTHLVDEVANSTIVVQQSSEQDNDVQMVMRSLKELQELQEMKYSPGHSPVGVGQQKIAKTSHQYVGYQDDYRLYNKKDEKIRVTKEETPSW